MYSAIKYMYFNLPVKGDKPKTALCAKLYRHNVDTML